MEIKPKYGKKYRAGKHEVVCAVANEKTVHILKAGREIDLIYTDPAWTQHWVSDFRKRAGIAQFESIEQHLTSLVGMCKVVNPKWIALEINTKYLDFLITDLTWRGAEIITVFHPNYGEKKINYHVVIASFREKRNPFKGTIDGVNFSGENDACGKFLFEELKPKSVMEILMGEGRYLPVFVKNNVLTMGFDFNPDKVAKALKMYAGIVKEPIQEIEFEGK